MGSGSIVWWTLVLFVIVIGGFILVVQVKRWASKDDEGSGENFTLSDLRRLHKAGKMTTEEYEKAREAIVVLAQRAQPKPESPGSKAPLGSSDLRPPPPTA